MTDPDDVLEKIVIGTAWLWGPFYAIFYILRLLIREIFNRRE